MGDDIILVNFEALDGAVTDFTSSSSRIGGLANEVSNNASAIQAAITSVAADNYVAKVQALAQNVIKAQELLNVQIQDLTTKLEEARATEARAQSIADSVNVFDMQ